MSNHLRSERTDLPPDSENTKYAPRKRWSFTGQPFIRLASKLLTILQIVTLFATSALGKIRQRSSRLSKKMKSSMTIATLVATAVLAGHVVEAQVPLPFQPLAPLKTVGIPEPDTLNDYVKDKVAAIALGKSLFWDMQLGSDGIQSCASCHFHAGADNRSKNQLNPGLLRVNADRSQNPDTTFNTGGGPNYQLTVADYPFHKVENPNNRNRSSTVLSDSNDVTSSQGVFNTEFVDVVPGSAEDQVNPLDDEVFNVGGTEVRRVPPRNTPTVINAVFNFRNFWDGRAQDIFNGVNPFGLRDPETFVLKAISPTQLAKEPVKLNNSSLASQAVGPPTNETEISAGGRNLRALDAEVAPDQQLVEGSSDDAEVAPNQELVEGSSIAAQNDTLFPLASQNQLENLTPKNIGKKMLSLTPLGKQVVHPDDSVLGVYTKAPERGLNQTYSSLIQTAFKPEWWDSNMIISFDENKIGTVISRPNRPLTTKEITLMEYNFSLFFGLAVQAYESTLVSDDAPIDRYLAGNTSALTRDQVIGKEIFEGRGKCINCHGGAELTNASVKNVRNERLERIIRGDGQEAFYDNGFFNIGVRQTLEDLGVGGDDPSGEPLSEARLAQQGRFNALLASDPNLTVGSNQRVTVDGAFKTPGLRNVELTAPYFHNGGQLTLEQVVDFYNRGGDFNEQNADNLDPNIRNLNLSDRDKTSLVAFLKTLTDERVRFEKAPFDHPQLFIPNGHPGDQTAVTNDGTGKATDTLLEIPAVGRNGLGTPRANFLATP